MTAKKKEAEKIEAGRVYGYCRVSTDKQDSERQQSEILDYAKKHGLGDVTIFRETMSGTKEKPELERLLSGLKQGDTLAVWELSRLTRSGISAVFEIAGRVRKAGAVLLETSSGRVIGNDTNGEVYLFALGLSAKIEKEMISERTKSALKMRKEKGMILGRPAGKSKLDEKKLEIQGYQKMELSKAKIAKLVGCSRSTYLAWLEKETEKAGK